MKAVISMCDKTGNMVRPWAAAGYECWCVDMQHSSGARDHERKAGWMLADAVQLFDSVEVAFSFGGFPYMMENPVGRLSTHRRKPDYSFQPWQYGDMWTKKTCIWAGNGFIMPPPIHATEPEGVTEKIWLMPPGDERADMRSETPPGFAKAVFEANHKP